MELHKPRPVHNWRELATEVGVIVVGIIIALSAEQVLQGLEWRHKIRRAEEQMRFEMSRDDGPEILQRVALGGCIDDGLAGVRASIERAEERAAVIAATNKVDIPRHTYENDAYHAAEVSGVLAQLEPQRVDGWNHLYSGIPVLDRIAEREYFDAAALHAIRNSGGPLSEPEQLRVLEAVENLRRDNRGMVRQATESAQELKKRAIALDRVRMRQMLDELRGNPAFGSCAEKLRSLLGYEP